MFIVYLTNMTNINNNNVSNSNSNSRNNNNNNRNNNALSLFIVPCDKSIKVTVHIERCFQFSVCEVVNTHRTPTNNINRKLMKLSN